MFTYGSRSKVLYTKDMIIWDVDNESFLNIYIEINCINNRYVVFTIAWRFHQIIAKARLRQNSEASAVQNHYVSSLRIQ